MPKQKIFWIDMAKAFGMFCIVLGHVLRGGRVYEYLLSFHVPLFFMMSGVVFDAKKYDSYKTFFIKKFKSIMVPYFVWGIISLLIFQVFGEFAGEVLDVEPATRGFGWDALGLLYGNHEVSSLRFNLPLWFLPCLFLVQNIFYFIDRKLNVKKYSVYIITAVLFILAGLNQNVFLIRHLPFNGENALFMSGYFALGMMYRRYKYFNDTKTWAVPESIAGVALIAVSIAVSVTNTHIAYNPSMYGVYWKFMVSSLCGVIGWTLIMRRIPQNRMCTYIASTTIAILVMHKFPIVFFQTIVPVVKDYLFVNNIWVALIITVVVMVMCAVVERIISAFIPEVFGKPGKFSEKITARIARKG